jgi:hypothetical protein
LLCDTAIDSTGFALLAASKGTLLAARACEDWENGGDAGPVVETAASALRLAQTALEAAIADEPWNGDLEEPATRRGRLAYAGWLLLMAGADEHGQRSDLDTAAQLFVSASEA